MISSPSPPDKSFDAAHVYRTILMERRRVMGIVLIKNQLNMFRAFVDPTFQMVQQVANGEVRLAE